MAALIPSIPRPPLGLPDPLCRIRVPKDLGSVTTVGVEADPAAGGVSAGNVEAIWRAVTDWYRSGVHPALQVCVRRDGEVILDRAIGHARGNGPRDGAGTKKVAATPQTPFCIYSTSKAITAFVVHKLAERGLLDLDDPIAEHLPGYEAHGKGSITIGHVLAHRAGVPNLPREVLDLDYIGDHELLSRALCDARPFAEPGRYLAYHAISGGFILGEVVRSVSGKVAPSSPTSSSIPSDFAGPTTGSRPATSSRSRSTTSPARARPRRSPRSSAARSARGWTT